MGDIIPLLPIEEFDRRMRRRRSSTPELWDLLDEVMDPEIPVVSLWEMGILQDINVEDEHVRVAITPTYSGCPAIEVMAEDVVIALKRAGYTSCEVQSRLSPAWSTNWISEEAQEKLRAYGIAPPGDCTTGDNADVLCPQCESSDVSLLSEFGSTACKSLYKCNSCMEPFDHFKPV